MESIADAVNADYADITIDATVDYTAFAGGFFVRIHRLSRPPWYHDLHADPDDPAWNIAAGHIHVGAQVGRRSARIGSRITLRTLTDYLDTQVPEPGALVLVLFGALWAFRRR